MKVKLLKFFIVGAFLAFTACAFFISGNGKIEAQSRETARKKAEILEKVADYKAWKQVVKPVGQQASPEVISVSDSSSYG
ncbi:MAG TPA: hypothetical protein VF599_19775 [Pyrinomonadaceae bacterium]